MNMPGNPVMGPEIKQMLEDRLDASQWRNEASAGNDSLTTQTTRGGRDIMPGPYELEEPSREGRNRARREMYDLYHRRATMTVDGKATDITGVYKAPTRATSPETAAQA